MPYETASAGFVLAPARHKRCSGETSGEIGQSSPSAKALVMGGAFRAHKRGELLVEQSGQWQLQGRYLQLEGLQSLADNQPTRLPAVAG